MKILTSLIFILLFGLLSYRVNIKYPAVKLIEQSFSQVNNPPISEKIDQNHSTMPIDNQSDPSTKENNTPTIAKIQTLIGRNDLNGIKSIYKRGELNLEERDSAGNTPLLSALDQGNHEIVNFLIDRGAKLNVKNTQGLSSTAMAAFFGDLEIYKKISKASGEKNPILYGKKNALMNAALSGHQKLAQFILDDEETNPNLQDDQGQTSLYLAVLAGHPSIVKLLMSKNADPTIKNLEGISPIDLAQKEEDQESLSFLMNNDFLEDEG